MSDPQTTGGILSLMSHAGYWVEGAAVFLESLPVVGTFVPGQSFVMASGFLVRFGVLNPVFAWVVGAIAAIAGDFTAFILGKKYGTKLISKFGKRFPSIKEKFKKVGTYVDRHPAKALITSRFNPVTRSVAPFIAGSTDIATKKFVTYNILSAVSWSAAWVLIGYVFGTSYEIAVQYISRALYIAVVGGIILWVSYFVYKSEQRALSRVHLFTFVINIVSLYFFVKLTEDLILRRNITYIDIAVREYIPFLRDFVLTFVMKWMSIIFSPYVLLAVACGVCAFFITKKRWRELLFILSSSAGLLGMLAVKYLMHRPRPLNGVMHTAGYSFPSGHTTAAIIFGCVAVYLSRKWNVNVYWRVVLNVSIFITVALVSFSRLYLGEHWLSDILAGISLGIFWMTLIIMIFSLVRTEVKQRVKRIAHIKK